MIQMLINWNPLEWIWNWELVIKLIGLITGVYEILIRLWPTVGDYTIIGNIIKFLRWLSDLLNNNKSEKIV